MNDFLAVIAIDEITGAAKISKLFVDIANKNNIKTLCFYYKLDFKAYAKKMDYKNKFFKFISFLKIFYQINNNISKIKAAYIQENHGFGKFYDILFIFLFLIYKKKCFYHNHSSSKYIRSSFLTKIIKFLSKFNVTNIFLSNLELKKFTKRYGQLNKYFCISNSLFIKDIEKYKKIISNPDILKFGLLSNLTKEKGLDKFIDLARYSLENNKLWEFYLAGPIFNDKEFYLKKINNLPNLKYLGIIHNEKDKFDFYQNLDFFIFLTTYINESEPLVLLEAISLSCIPIVYDKGSISNLICRKKLILNHKDNPNKLIDNLIKEIIKNDEIKTLSINSSKLFKKYKESYKIELYKLIREIQSL